MFSSIKSILISLMSAGMLVATPQEPDRILIDGEGLSLLTYPSFPSIAVPDIQNSPKFYGSVSSSNWRMYTATWEIKDGKLWIVHVSGTLLTKPATNEEIEALYNKMRKPESPAFDPNQDYKLLKIILNSDKSRQEPASLQLLFPGLVHNGRVFAYWYTGGLHVVKGEHWVDTNDGRELKFDQEYFFDVVNGLIHTPLKH